MELEHQLDGNAAEETTLSSMQVGDGSSEGSLFHETEIPPEFSQETWDKAGKWLSALNNGVKAALFLGIAENSSPGTYVDIDKLTELFKNLFAGTELLKALEDAGHIRHQVIGYCSHSLVGVGLVAAEFNLQDKPVGFGITDEGVQSINAALFVLATEYSRSESLYPILGVTSSSSEDSRAPYNRARILDYLSRRSHISDIDIEKDINVHQGVSGMSLHILSKPELELVHYIAVSSQTGKVQIQYQRIPGIDIQQSVITHDPTLTQEAVKIISQMFHEGIQVFSRNDITDRFDHAIYAHLNKDSLNRRVNAILGKLAKQRLLSRVHSFKGGEKASDADLLPKGRELLRGFIWPFMSIVQGKLLDQDLQARLDRINKNLTFYARASAESYFPHSRSYQMKHSEENRRRTIGFLVNSPGRFSNRELMVALGLREKSVGRYLKPGVKGANELVLQYEGGDVVIRITKDSGVIYYQNITPERLAQLPPTLNH